MQLRKKNVKISTPEFKEGQKKKNMLLQYYVNGKKKEIPPNIKKKTCQFLSALRYLLPIYICTC